MAPVGKKSLVRRGAKPRPSPAAPATNGHGVPLRALTEQALDQYFASLNGHAPGHLYELVLREVEEPLLRAVLDYVGGNQSRAAEVLGLNRGTLRKKLKSHGIAD